MSTNQTRRPAPSPRPSFEQLPALVLANIVVGMWVDGAHGAIAKLFAGVVAAVVLLIDLGVVMTWMETKAPPAAAGAGGKGAAGARGAGSREPPPGEGEMLVMGPAHVSLQHRRDPYTRMPFAAGERLVRCGGRCGRLYKLTTCEVLQYRCPVDGASLRTRATSV